MGLMLVQMTWAAGELWLQEATVASGAGFLGCLVYILSATLLAIHDYRRPLPWGHTRSLARQNRQKDRDSEHLALLEQAS